MNKRRILAITTVIALLAALVPLSASAEGTFTDDDGNIHESAIEEIAALGITKGCNPPTNDLYCPDENVTRGQMAAFLVRALDLTESGDSAFTDDDGSVFEQDIERLAHAGITKGCNPPDNTRFCPDDSVTRGQMAAFLVRALGLTDTGDSAFVDDDDSVFELDIERLAAAGITRGCNPPANDRFCPDNPVRRDEMATFLSRAVKINDTGTTTSSTSSTSSSSTSSTSSSSTSSSSTSSTSTTIVEMMPWSEAPEDMDPGLVSAGYTKLGPNLYVAGGKTGAGPTDRVTTFQRYHMQNDNWTDLADVPGAAREDIALVEHEGLIYAFGGATTIFDQGDSLVAAVYNPGTNMWNDAAVLNLAAGLTSATAISWDGAIWIIGGFDSAGNSLDQVLIYDPDTNTYSPGPSLPQARDNANATIQDAGGPDQLYVLGGRAAQSSFPFTKQNTWRLNAAGDGWDVLAQMPRGRRSFVVATVDDKIQVFGGERDGVSAIPEVDEYDPTTNTWSTLTGFDWPIPRHGAVGAQAQVGGVNVVFLAGGSTTGSATGTTDAVDSFTRSEIP